jgi:SPP1 family predicted phage head-tail adaptor
MLMQPFKYQPNFNSGSFRHRILIQKHQSIQDELGQDIGEEWVNVKSVWAMIKTMQGREYLEAAASRSETIVRFITRYTTGIDETMRLVYKGKTYEIVAPPINDNELNKTLTIITKS